MAQRVLLQERECHCDSAPYYSDKAALVGNRLASYSVTIWGRCPQFNAGWTKSQTELIVPKGSATKPVPPNYLGPHRSPEGNLKTLLHSN